MSRARDSSRMNLSRLQVDGKFFKSEGRRFHFRGVTYGTFGPREDGSLFPERDQIKRDFSEMAQAGFTVVRTYTTPPPDLLDIAADWGVKILAGVFYPDWRYLVGASRRQQARMAREARAEVREAARRLCGVEAVAALCVGNEVPADAVRWVGTNRVASTISQLAEVVREEDPELLVTYANFPPTEFLPLDGLDFLTFNVFLENQTPFRRYLTRLHHLSGDRPVVLGEIGFHGQDELRQAEVIDWQLSTALERGIAGTCIFSWTDEWWVAGSRVEGWKFGLTKEDRSRRPALIAARKWNQRGVEDIDYDWPSISVVICAHNASSTVDECLWNVCSLDYPGLDIVVVDDGSTDDTADIACRYPRARLVQIPHGGLSTARNAGVQAARGDLIAFLDADAYPSPEWPFYIALGVGAPNLSGTGGPNIPPLEDPTGAHQVARAPGGPVHVLLSDDRAEHVPGCNMAFWKAAIEEVGGFDPAFVAAGDDVDFCWKVLDGDGQIGFHPAAFVWHHSREGWRTYLKQQRVYGRSEALLEARHPDRFTPLGTARWRGRIYDSLSPRLFRQRVYRGIYGSAAYQSVYGAGGDALVISHQVGAPAAFAAIFSIFLGLIHAALALPALAAAAFLFSLGIIDFARTRPPGTLKSGRIRFRAGVAILHILQPLVRLGGRWHTGIRARRELQWPVSLPAPFRKLRRGAILLPADRARPAFARDLIAHLRRGGVSLAAATGWEDYDARLFGSSLVAGDLVTSGYPHGSVQVRVRRRLRPWPVLVGSLAALSGSFITPVAGLAVSTMIALELVRGLWGTGPRVRKLVRRATEAEGAAIDGG